jgi:circadian clock protein KaiC
VRTQAKESTDRCKFGIEGLDGILRGGLPRDRVYLIQGEPGTGKTTLSLQFLMEGAREGEKGLYVSFSETKEELLEVARSHGWDLTKVDLLELSANEQQLSPEAQSTVFHPSEVEMGQTIQLLLQEVERVRPARVVFDSVSEIRMLADSSLRYRRQMLALKQFFTGRHCTVLLLDDLTSASADLQVQSVVHGVLNLEKLHHEFGDERRRLNVVKVRGLQFLGGYHDYRLERGGIHVFPRMTSASYHKSFPKETVSSGIPALDTLLGGGVDRGTSNLLLGPAGTGKSTLAIQYALAAVERGEHAAIYLFEESLTTLLSRTESLGMDLEGHLESGRLHIEKIDPAQLSPGEFSEMLRSCVTAKGTRVLVIDSLNGYLHAMPKENFLILQLHELLAFLSGQGVVTLMVLAQAGLMGNMSTPIDLTYLSDTVLITRFFEAGGAVKKAVSVIKKRGGAHETTIREFNMGENGIVVGQPLEHFRGVLTGTPEFVGGHSQIMEHDGLRQPEL